MAENVVAAHSIGQLERGLKSQQIQVIALGGTIGTGLFLGIGGALAQAGPLSLFLGYLLSSIAIWAMTTDAVLGRDDNLALPGMIAQLGSRFVDPAFGFALGWNQWFIFAIAICGEISAAVVLVQFWDDSISPAVGISIILILVLLLNCATVTIYGEAEFWFAFMKIITIVGLLIFALVIDLGGGPNRDRLGFRYWKDPGAMKTNPTRSIPKAIDRVFYVILFFYVFGAFAVGLIVPSNSPDLLSVSSTAKSPWIIASQNAGFKVLPHIINAVVITSASSSANANLYTGSRYLYALAQQSQASKIFLRCNRQGNPYVCILMTGLIGVLKYMTVSAGGATVF
ncbi:hypothetical protein IFR04_009911 [Cadophora malorum]|uniref:Amino acid permease/ SLC12A domain-containing protein n=1 Tax=Cadophora malorum TaxID=108018 RepID=A0A8H7W6B9_9HELO|nr:hypothetical protein IFR04_009911 [Cadophora malorum]